MQPNDLPDGVGVETVYLVEVPYTSEAPMRRPPIRPLHLAKVAALLADGTLVEAGGCLDWSKAVLLVRAPDAQTAVRLMEDDVYTAEGVWHSPTAVPFGRITVGDAARATYEDPALAAELLGLELALARRDPNGVPSGLEALLDDEFEEVGASGRRSDRASTVDFLRAEPPGTIEIERFRVARLAGDVCLVTYDAIVRRPDGAAVRASRSSVWVRRGDRWRMRFHQGTPSDRG